MMKKEKVYVSGKITGFCYDRASQSFKYAEDYVVSVLEGVPVNPIKEVKYERCKSWGQYMLEDLKLLIGCDSIFMINNWESSKGARFEKRFAESLGKKVIYEF